GQDSTTCLAWALNRFSAVETVGFEYGQRHHSEMAARPRLLGIIRERFPGWASRLGPDHVLSLDVLRQIGGTALTDEIGIELGHHGFPNTFVPGRNLMFLTAAAALAYRRDIQDLIGGMCETDFSGYPDCRNDTIRAIQQAINLGMNAQFRIHTPLMFVDKAATWKLAEQLGGKELVALVRENTVTCYLGSNGQRHEWGYGCAACPACRLRAEGYRQYMAAS
ncbi:MAG: 7-cyano-7-deazaguanine synthase QueC, partial [Alphaproteobacteria bacterium]|nr:7-cyano-7-deazaguanine synthase QueC [Alphaproteobacteria bacterium]